MLYTVRIEINHKDAEVIAKALKPDDLGWARSYTENENLVVEVKTHKIGALMNAVEDFFMNIKPVLSFLPSLEQD